MSPAHPLSGLVGWLLLALGASLLEGERERRLAGGGLLAIGLALAAWRATSTDPRGTFDVPEGADPGFVVVNGGLLLLGLGVALWTGFAPRSRHLGSALATSLGAFLIGRLGAGFAIAGGALRVVGTALALGVSGAALVLVGRKLLIGWTNRTLGRRRPGAPPAFGTWPRSRTLLVSLSVGTVVAALGHHVAVVFVGVIAAAWSGFLLFHPPGSRPFPVTLVLTSLLVPTFWLLHTIAGPEGLRLDALPLVPLSPAAESIVAPILLLVGWSLAGLWPLHRQVPGALTGPAGALLLIRVAFPLASGGLEYLRPLAMPLVIAGVWHAALVGRWPLVSVGAAFLGISSVTSLGTTGAGWLLGSALAVELAWSTPGRSTARAIEAIGWVAGAGGGLLVLEGSLRGEVVYTALGVLGLAVAVVVGRAGTATAVAPPAPAR